MRRETPEEERGKDRKVGGVWGRGLTARCKGSKGKSYFTYVKLRGGGISGEASL